MYNNEAIRVGLDRLDQSIPLVVLRLGHMPEWVRHKPHIPHAVVLVLRDGRGERARPVRVRLRDRDLAPRAVVGIGGVMTQRIGRAGQHPPAVIGVHHHRRSQRSDSVLLVAASA